MPRVAFALVWAVALAACGELRSPDLGTGTLAGRLANATAAAYVYPLGRPDLVVFPAADGRFTLDRVPVETVSLVAVDGAAGAWRAELVPVIVEAGERRQAPERDAAAMPAAGRVAAVARFAGASESAATRFSVVGTDQVDVSPGAPGAAAVMERLPAGTFVLSGRSGGFAEASAAVEVRSGETVPQELELEIEYEDDAPGCTDPFASCRPGLFCDPADGVCYECVEDSHCAAPQTWCANHVCRVPDAKGETCEACGYDDECEPVTSGPAVVCTMDGFCSHECTGDADCPAGFACQPDGQRSVCRAPNGCEEAREELGAECFFDPGCTDDLFGGVCHGEVLGDEPLPGYCTGACSRPDDCDLVPGFVCDTGLGLCLRP